MNWLTRKIEAWRYARQLDRNLAARKQARLNGQIYVSSYRRKA